MGKNKAKNEKIEVIAKVEKEKGEVMENVEMNVAENDVVIAENVEVESEKTELSKEEKRELVKMKLAKKLEEFPRTLTIRELIYYRHLGLETWLNVQRTPSHDKPKAIAIIKSAIDNISCGVITLGINTDDNDAIVTVNGSSRIQDFINFYTGELSSKELEFKELSVEQKAKFLNHKLTIDWLKGTEKQLAIDFKNHNNDTALTGGQKALTNLVGSDAMTIVNTLSKHSVFNTFLSPRQIQKQENNNAIFLLLSNICGCYNAKIDTVTTELANKDLSYIDLDKLVAIFDKVEKSQAELTKFKLVHFTHIAYIGKCVKSKNFTFDFELDDLTDSAINNAISVNYNNAGTNSASQNDIRITSMSKRLYQYFESIGFNKVKEADTTDNNELRLDDMAV